ncbi:MAG: ferrous iron transport protein A [Verrucomicrobiae bacterium]|nr:ferrous iron transport protein A [Verrucomicrobiae bacterium]MCP5516338.1 ferrous iron transport protein A [Verrucomicrobiales bacterium]
MEAAAQPLLQLAPGQAAVVAGIEGPEESRTRLLELGLVPGTPVQLIRFAPLGDPVEIKLRGYNLTLRRHEAETVRVQPHR